MGKYAAALKGESWDGSKHPRDDTTGRFTESGQGGFATALRTSQLPAPPTRPATPDFRTPTPNFRTDLSPHTTPYQPPPPKKPSTFPPTPSEPLPGQELLLHATTEAAIHGTLGGLRTMVEVDSRELGGGIMETRLVTATDANGKTDQYVLKPESGGNTAYVQGGTLAGQEVAAYEIDRALGLGMVPETFLTESLRDGRGKTGLASAQHFLTGAVTGTKLAEHPEWMPGKQPGTNAQWYKMAVLDAVIHNTDRHSGNFMFDKDGNLHAIDHGLAFSEPYGSGKLDSYYMKKVEETTLPNAARAELVRRLRETDWLAVVGSHLTDEKRNQVQTRAKAVADAIENLKFRETFFH